MARTSIVLVGQGRWARSLAKGLREAGLDVDVAEMDSIRRALSVATWRLVARADVIARIGFRPGAKTWRGFAFDLAIRLLARPRARTCCYWIGTDVMHAAEEARMNAKVSAWRTATTAVRYHIAGSEPLRDELLEAGIRASVLGFPWRTVNVPSTPPPFPEIFTVATYIPDVRSDFYGGSVLLESAKRLPFVRFEVMGGDGTWATDPPENVVFLGWLGDPTDLYARSSCVLRLTEHDSIGGTAVEGLLFGRPVLYTQELKYAQKIASDPNVVVAAIQRLVDRYESGDLAPNEEAAEWAREEFDPDRRFASLASYLRSL